MKETRRNRLIISLVVVLGIALVIGHFVGWYADYYMGVSVNFDGTRQTLTVDGLNPDYVLSGEIAVGDRIIKIEGIPQNSMINLRRTIEETLFKSDVHLTVEHNGRPSAVIMRGTLRPITLRGGLFALIGLILVIFGAWIALAKPTFAIAVTSGMAIFLLGCVLMMQPVVLGYGGMFTGTLHLGLNFSVLAVAILLFHFSLIFPKPGKWAKARWPLRIAYGSLLIFLPSFLIYYGYLLPDYFDLVLWLDAQEEPVTAVWLMIMLSLTIFTLIRTYIGTREKLERQRMRWIMVGVIVPLGYILTIITYETITQSTVITPIWIRALITLIMPTTFFYAIVRYRSLDLSIIFRKGLTYTLVTGSILVGAGAVFLLFFVLPLVLFDRLAELGEPFASIRSLFDEPVVQQASIAVWAVAAGATIGRLKRRAQETVDKMFYREQFNYRQAISTYATVLERSDSAEEFCDRINATLETLMHPSSSAVALRFNPEEIIIRSSGERQLGELDHDTFERLVNTTLNREYLGRNELEEEFVGKLHPALFLLNMLQCDILFPIRTEEQTYGFILLGPKKSDLPYNQAEIDLLKLLASQAAVGTERLRLAAEAVHNERVRRELEIGREIQQNMLPSKMPNIDGAELAAMTVSASEVGGDFYTFIEYGPRKLGLIAGDIVGKGVGGALNMAASLSSLSILAEQNEDIAGSLNSLNNYLVHKAPARMFAAITFGIVDLEGGSFRWCNAGLPDPILMPVEGPVRFLEMPEYAYPPGASSRSSYSEQHVDFKAGDAVLLVTDGVTEVRARGNGSYLGYDGLLAFLEGQRHAGPQQLLANLREYVIDYGGEEDLEDDLTAVLLRASA